MIIENNVITDGNFETQDSKAWVYSSGTAVQIEDGGVNHYCRIKSTGSILQNIYLEKNTRYKITFVSRCKAVGEISITDMELQPAILFSKKFNTELSEQWKPQVFEFKTSTKAGLLKLRINVPWNSGDFSIDVDNIGVSNIVFEYNTPVWIDMYGASNPHFDFQTKPNVPSQHNRLYINQVLSTEIPDVVADTHYVVDYTISSSDTPDDIFTFVAVDNRTKKEYQLYSGTRAALLAPGTIVL